MRIIENQKFSSERALYNSQDLKLINCIFEGEEDGESALKESCNIEVIGSQFKLRYPLWHDKNVKVSDSNFYITARAPLWYTSDIEIKDTDILSPKALRECDKIKISNSTVDSSEFGWNISSININNTKANGEYFMLRARDITLNNVEFSGKYSFQYIENAKFENCTLNTKDALWHAKNVHLKNCTVIGEYLGWYSENVTFENCIIKGTQPLCYCKSLTLINCEMHECDLAFEKSEIYAEITTRVISIKNPTSGKICLPCVDEIIKDDTNSRCEILIREGELSLK